MVTIMLEGFSLVSVRMNGAWQSPSGTCSDLQKKMCMNVRIFNIMIIFNYFNPKFMTTWENGDFESSASELTSNMSK